MILLKGFLWWVFILMLFFADTKNKSEGYMWRFTVEICTIILCLTLIYVFGS